MINDKILKNINKLGWGVLLLLGILLLIIGINRHESVSKYDNLKILSQKSNNLQEGITFIGKTTVNKDYSKQNISIEIPVLVEHETKLNPSEWYLSDLSESNITQFSEMESDKNKHLEVDPATKKIIFKTTLPENLLNNEKYFIVRKIYNSKTYKFVKYEVSL